MILTGIVENSIRQLNLFYERDRKLDSALMSALDKINDRFGSRNMRFGPEGIDPEWAAKFEKKSPQHTTRWDELTEAG